MELVDWRIWVPIVQNIILQLLCVNTLLFVYNFLVLVKCKMRYLCKSIQKMYN